MTDNMILQLIVKVVKKDGIQEVEYDMSKQVLAP